MNKNIRKQDIDPAALRDSMLAKVSLEAEDVGHVTEALDQLLESLVAEPLLPPWGFDQAVANYENYLARFDAITRERRENPEIAKVKVAPPMVVYGLGRSGTTFLHALLAQDPDNRAPLTWEVNHPSPPPRAENYGTDPRIAQTEMEMARSLNPEMQRKHLSGALLPSEDNQLMAACLRALMLWATTRSMPYVHWHLEADARPAYRTHHRYLQHLQWANPKPRWALKCPEHIFYIGELLEVYPDAMLIQTHRDPAEIISSISSLICTLRQGWFDVVDPHAVGLEMLNFWEAGIRRALTYRRAHPKLRVCDIAYRDVVQDPLGTAERIYDFFGIPMTEAARRAMADFVADYPLDKYGLHRHRLPDYGLTASRVYEVFTDYTETFRDYF